MVFLICFKLETQSWQIGALILKRTRFSGSKVQHTPLCKGKNQFSESELVETRCIASLRIHVERAMEQLKNFHIFDGPLPSPFRDTGNVVFFVCAVLTNFLPTFVQMIVLQCICCVSISNKIPATFESIDVACDKADSDITYAFTKIRIWVCIFQVEVQVECIHHKMTPV